MFGYRVVTAILAAAMLVVAGCTGGVPGGAGDAAADGSVTLYVSDQPGAMDDFEHLNVTIDRVAYHRASATDDSGETEDDSANGTNATGAEGADDDDAEDGPAAGDGWETYDIDDTTVDLTELQGENATVVGQQRLPNGTYDRVYLYVSDVEGTLDDGSETRVKLPSGKLQVEKRFTVGANESLDFVFDATVVKAGNSGKYVLTPVVSESGTDIPIQEVARDEESGVSARFLGNVARGEAVTMKVTQDGQPVAGATVEVGDRTYQTGGDGTVTFDVPAEVEELEVEVGYDDAEVELKRTFPEVEDDDDDARGDSEDDDDAREDDAGDDDAARDDAEEDGEN